MLSAQLSYSKKKIKIYFTLLERENSNNDQFKSDINFEKWNHVLSYKTPPDKNYSNFIFIIHSHFNNNFPLHYHLD